MEEFIKSLSGFLTPIIAIVTAYIAVQQYRLSKFKVRQEMYDRRSKVYKAVMEYLSNISMFNEPADELSTKLIRETSEAFFLFKPEIKQHIESLYNKGIDLWAIKEELKDTTQDPEELKKSRKAVSEIVKWFRQQYEVYKSKQIV